MLKRLQTAVFDLLSTGSLLRSDHRVAVVLDDEQGARAKWEAALQTNGICVLISAPRLAPEGGLGRVTIGLSVVEDVQVCERYGGRQSSHEVAGNVANMLNGARPLDEFGPLFMSGFVPTDGETQGQRAYDLTFTTQTPL